MVVASPPCLLAAAEIVRHRVTSGLLDGLREWWHGPALVAAAAAVVAVVAWSYRRDAAELSPWLRALLPMLRLGALAAVALAALDLERSSELEVVVPSRVAVLVDTSASMALADDEPAADRAAADADAATGAPTRVRLALDALDEGGLVAALAARHEVAIWRFDAAAERVAVLARAGTVGAAWRERIVADGTETRLGDALATVVEREPAGSLAGIVLVSDGAGNAGADPRSAAAMLAAARVPVVAIGAGADAAPTNLRVADLVAPARVFPGDRFTVTAYLQGQGLEGTRVRVELSETAADGGAARSLEPRDAVVGPDGELVAVRFDLAGSTGPGRHTLVVRATPPAGDRVAADDSRSADVEVVDRVTRVLVMAGGPGREFQFLRGVLERDKSFAVDVLLGTARGDPTAGALAGFPATDEALAEYDAVVACDWDWRRLDAAARARLERWVARESGGLLLVAGPVAMDAWLGEPGMDAVRGLYPVELRRPSQPPAGPGAATDPRPLAFTRDGLDAEFLWLAGTRAESELAWSAFPGMYACHPAGPPKPGTTVYARAAGAAGGGAVDDGPVALAGHFFGSGTVVYVGSGELWRLRSVDPVLHERLVAQLVRHVAQARLLRGARRGRLLVDRDRVPLGGGIGVRLVLPAGAAPAAAPPACRAVGPDGTALPIALVAEPGRPEVLRGTAPAARQGTWRIEVDAGGPGADERLVRRVQVELPDRELVEPRLHRVVLEEIAAATTGRTRFLHDAPWSVEEATALATLLPDRTRREYEAGADDDAFKRRLNAALLAVGTGCLCLEWLLRRLAKLA